MVVAPPTTRHAGEAGVATTPHLEGPGAAVAFAAGTTTPTLIAGAEGTPGIASEVPSVRMPRTVRNGLQDDGVRTVVRPLVMPVASVGSSSADVRLASSLVPVVGLRCLAEVFAVGGTVVCTAPALASSLAAGHAVATRPTVRLGRTNVAAVLGIAPSEVTVAVHDAITPIEGPSLVADASCLGEARQAPMAMRRNGSTAACTTAVA